MVANATAKPAFRRHQTEGKRTRTVSRPACHSACTVPPILSVRSPAMGSPSPVDPLAPRTVKKRSKRRSVETRSKSGALFSKVRHRPRSDVRSNPHPNWRYRHQQSGLSVSPYKTVPFMFRIFSCNSARKRPACGRPSGYDETEMTPSASLCETGDGICPKSGTDC